MNLNLKLNAKQIEYTAAGQALAKAPENKAEILAVALANRITADDRFTDADCAHYQTILTTLFFALTGEPPPAGSTQPD